MRCLDYWFTLTKLDSLTLVSPAHARKHNLAKGKRKEKESKRSTSQQKWSIPGPHGSKCILLIAQVQRKSPLEEGCSLIRVHTTAFNFSQVCVLWWLNPPSIFKHFKVLRWLSSSYMRVNFLTPCYEQSSTCWFRFTCKRCFVPVAHMVRWTNNQTDFFV